MITGFSVISYAVAPTFVAPSPQAISVCQNAGAYNFSSLLTVSDIDAAQTETWSVIAPFATKGVVTTGVTTRPSGSAIITTTGWLYTPNTGATGADQIVIRVTDGTSVATMIINVTINQQPGTIVGPNSVCRGQAITLTDIPAGGLWSSNNGGRATVEPTTGIVHGTPNNTNTASTVTITYNSNGCTASKNITVNPLTPITGAQDICAYGQSSVTLHNNINGGIWSSTGAPVTNTGGFGSNVTVNSMAAGPVSVSYTLTTGCVSTTTLTVNPLPDPITGPNAVCVNSTVTLATTSNGGNWSTSNFFQAGVDQSGVVTGVSAGTPTISYTLPTTCYATFPITVNALPDPIAATTVCMNAPHTTLNGNPGGGTFTSASPYFTTSNSGEITPVSTGVGNVTYTLPTGCQTVTTVTVNPTPDPITGNTTFCQNGSTTLSDATAGGTWMSDNTNVANIDMNSGFITSSQGGTANITYTLPTGCIVTTVVTVNPISPIFGSTGVCKGSTVSIFDFAGGGTWSSSNANATIDQNGTVTGVDVGTTTITYMMPTGCFETRTETINPLPDAITGTTLVCVGGTTQLNETSTGGTWASDNTFVADVNMNSGLVTGNNQGTASIYYILPTGCSISTLVTVNPIEQITYNVSPTICVGSHVALADATPNGTWSNDNAAVATIDGNGVVTGVSQGSTLVTYTTPAGCMAYLTVTVNPLPAAITGTFNVCENSTTIYNDVTPNGAWSSNDNSIATVDNGGLVYGVSGGSSTITYQLNATGCYVTAPITVNPIGTISGIPYVCNNTTTQLSDPVPGGGWFSASPLVSVEATTGIVHGGASNGVATITYTINATGCYTTYDVNVGALPNITGNTQVCAGSTTQLANIVPGGTWSSSDNNLATVTNAGLVAGVAQGIPDITYSVASNCATAVTITVDPLPTLTSAGSLCVNNQNFFIGHSPTGGTWSSSNPSVATINTFSNSGHVHPVAAGMDTITYTSPAGCVSTTTIMVNPLPEPIVGNTIVCPGITTTLSDATPGGVWSSNDPSNATVNPTTGEVTGVSTGNAFIRYTLPATGCRVAVNFNVTNTLPNITGSNTVCMGQTVTLHDNATGGTWISADPAVAAANPTTGDITGISSGTAIITYTLGGTCRRIRSEVVNALSPIVGSNVVCEDSTTTLVDTTFGGTWVSDNTGVAMIDANTGVVTGVAAGTANISYVLPTGCTAMMSFTVNPNPQPIQGIGTGVCVGTSTTLTDIVPGGSWASSDPTIASIDPVTGVVSGLMTGTVTITYGVPSGCTPATATLSVNPLPVLTSPATAPAICNNVLFDYTPTSDIPGTVFTWSRAAVTGISNTAATGSGNPAASPSTEVLVNTTPDPIVVSYIYTLSAGVTSCVSTYTVNVTVNPAILLTSGAPTSPICDSSTFTYTSTANITSAPVTFAWHRDAIAGNAAADGTGAVISEMLVNTTTEPVTVTYIDTLFANGCFDTVHLDVVVNPTPMLSSPTTIPAICDGGAFTYTSTSATAAVTAFGWHRDAIAGNPAADGTGDVISEVLINNTNDPVTVTYMDTMFIGTCYHVEEVTIVVNPSPVLTVTNPIPAGICDSTVFNYTPATPTTGSAITYSWTRPYTPGIGLLAGSGTGNISETLVNTTNTNVTVNYIYTLNAGSGCFNTQIVSVVVHPRPTLSSATGPFEICSGSAFSYGPTGYVLGTSFTWSRAQVANIYPATSNGTGNINEVLTDSFFIPRTVTYKYILTANGCSDSTYLSVLVNPSYNVPEITTHSASSVCLHTMLQNFGVASQAPEGSEFYWSATNATVYASGHPGQFALINFDSAAGPAVITVHSNVTGNGCMSSRSFTVDVKATRAEDINIIYNNGQFICLQNDEETYQWGFDDASTLESTSLPGETNQTYFNSAPDLTHRYYWVNSSKNGCTQKSYFNKPTGVSNVNDDATEVKIYPNPAHDLINVDINAKEGGKIEIVILDVLGQKISTVTAVNRRATVNVAGLATGVYLIETYRDGVKINAARFNKN